MSAIIRRRVPARTLSKKEFLTPFDRLFDDMLTDMFPAFHRQYGEDFFSKGSYPKVNVINHDNCVTIEAAIPGLTKEDIQVEVTDGVLSIVGTSNQNEQIKDSQYVKREIWRGVRVERVNSFTKLSIITFSQCLTSFKSEM